MMMSMTMVPMEQLHVYGTNYKVGTVFVALFSFCNVCVYLCVSQSVSLCDSLSVRAETDKLLIEN